MARAVPEAPAAKPAKAAKKTTAKKTAAPKAEKTNGRVDGEVKTRRPGGDRNWLAREIDKVIRKEGASMTVAEIVAKITNKHGEHPSSGAVAAALVRWAEQGYIETTAERPMAFKKFTAKYARKNLDDFLADQKVARKAARDAAKGK